MSVSYGSPVKSLFFHPMSFFTRILCAAPAFRKQHTARRPLSGEIPRTAFSLFRSEAGYAVLFFLIRVFRELFLILLQIVQHIDQTGRGILFFLIL